MTTTLRLTTTGSSGAWHGALVRERAGSRVRTTFTCGHSHRNRNTGVHTPARSCAAKLVRAARNELPAAAFVEDAVAAAGVARGLGARITDEEARAKAEATVAAWRAQVLVHDFHLPPPVWTGSNPPACGCCPRPVAP